MVCYPFAQVKDDGSVHYRRANRLPKAGEKKWPTTSLYGGLLAENVTQAVANDFLRVAITGLEQDKRFTLRLHTHDEAVAEVATSKAAGLVKPYEKLMLAGLKQPWAKGLPLGVKTHVTQRYCKG
jgi:DNA polymerase